MSNAKDGFEVDLSGYKERVSARLTPGEYLVRIEDAETGETKAGDPKVTLFYTVIGGAFDGSPLIDTLTLTEKALFRVVNVLRAVGLKVEKKKLVIPFKLLLGRTLTVTVADGDEYNGNIKSEIKTYGPAGAAGAAKVEPKADPVVEEALSEIAEEIGSEPEVELVKDDDSGEVSVPSEITL